MSARTTQQFVKGQTILAEGSRGDRTYKIVSGEVVVCKMNSKNEMVPLARLGPGEIFGEMYLFDSAQTRSASVIATSSDVVLEIYYEYEMQSMLTSMPPSMLTIMRGFSKRLQHTSGASIEGIQGTRMTRLPDGTVKENSTTVKAENGTTIKRTP